MTAGSKLTSLRKLFPEHDIGVYLVLTQDEHNSEYTGDSDNRREFISGFTGSAGTAVISSEQAALATDGRYYSQATKQLDPEYWTLLKQGLKNVPTWQEWAVSEAIRLNKSIGVDPKLITYTDAKELKQLLTIKDAPGSVKIVGITENLVDKVWGADRPQRPKEPVFILDQQYTGRHFQSKVEELKRNIDEKDGYAYVVSALDEIAWLFNLRSFGDILYNPVFFSYAIVEVGSDKPARLYIDSDKISEKIISYFDNKVIVKPYEEIWKDLVLVEQQLYAHNIREKSQNKAANKKLLVSADSSWAIIKALGGDANIKQIDSPVEISKGVKNPTELANIKKAQLKDGAAIVKYFAWLQQQLKKGAKITDYEGAVKSKEFRQEYNGFKDLSFETISSSGANAAVIHYSPAKDSKFLIDINDVYLLDSGGQYLEGTTDITRTVHFGTPSAKEIEAYTLVLKGHIALADVVFPDTVNGYALDTLARQFLWKYGLEYRHGTGHGIGALLNVHEGPIGVGFRPSLMKFPFQVGNYLSDEPGYYEDGKFGIRIESDMIVVEKPTKYKFDETRFLGFEFVTLVPFCRKLIDVDLLTVQEKKWINNYYEDVYKSLRPFFKEGEEALEYLRHETLPLY